MNILPVNYLLRYKYLLVATNIRVIISMHSTKCIKYRKFTINISGQAKQNDNFDAYFRKFHKPIINYLYSF